MQEAQVDGFQFFFFFKDTEVLSILTAVFIFS